MQALHEMKNITKWLAETKKRPPFQKEWQTNRIPRQSTGELHGRMCHIYGILLQQFSFCMGRAFSLFLLLLLLLSAQGPRLGGSR